MRCISISLGLLLGTVGMILAGCGSNSSPPSSPPRTAASTASAPPAAAGGPAAGAPTGPGGAALASGAPAPQQAKSLDDDDYKIRNRNSNALYPNKARASGMLGSKSGGRLMGGAPQPGPNPAGAVPRAFATVQAAPVAAPEVNSVDPSGDDDEPTGRARRKARRAAGAPAANQGRSGRGGGMVSGLGGAIARNNPGLATPARSVAGRSGGAIPIGQDARRQIAAEVAAAKAQGEEGSAKEPLLDTPEKAVQAFVEAVANHDQDVMALCMSERAIGRFERIRQRTMKPDDFDRVSQEVHGGQISGSPEEIRTNEQVVTLAIEPAEEGKAPKHTLVTVTKELGKWKILRF